MNAAERIAHLNCDTLRLDLSEGLLLVTLSRPEALNALSPQMIQELRVVFGALRTSLGSSEAGEDPDWSVRGVILTGDGPKSFVAGADISVMHTQTREEAAAYTSDAQELTMWIETLAVPVIAAVNGPAIGAGACLCMACDMRYAADTARIGFTFVRIGLHPGMGAEWFLTRAVGEAKAYELLMTGDILTAAEAERIGLVNRVVPAGELMEKTLELARKIAAQPSFPIKMLKQTVPAATRGELCDILRLEATYQAMCYSGGDLREGITAMIEKRPPRFADDA